MEKHDKVFIAALLVSMVISLLLVASVFAQPTVVAVDIAKSKLTWVWTRGAGGAVDKWQVNCGPAVGNYPLMLELPDPAARSMPLAALIKTGGTFVCMVRAVNSFGPSPDSPTVSFTSGTAPDAATVLKIESQ